MSKRSLLISDEQRSSEMRKFHLFIIIMSNISIVIPCYPPHIIYLDNTFNDILKQTILPQEVILAISGINEETKHILYNKFVNLFKNSNIEFSLIHTEKNQFAGVNRNMGATMAKNDYIMFIDADDCLHPQKIEITKYFLCKYNPNVLVHSLSIGQKKDDYSAINFDYINAEITMSETIYKNTFSSSTRNRSRELKGRNTCIYIGDTPNYGTAHGFPTVKRSVMDTFKYTDMKRAQDGVFLRDILYNIGGIIHVNLPLINYNKKRKMQQI